MASAGVKVGTAISVLVIIAAYFYKRNQDEELKLHVRSVLDGLLRAERKVLPGTETRVAVGVGGCQDAFADGVSVLNRIGARPPTTPQHYGHIKVQEELEQMFAYFFRHGAAAERYIKNETLFESLVDAARQTDGTRYAMGGNAPVMAARFAQEGCKVLLGAKLTKKLAKEISEEILVAGGRIKEDDVHLLLEYSKGTKWGLYEAPRANRFIVHSDRTNPTLSALEEFSSQVLTFKPKLLVVGGLQMMDDFPFNTGERAERLGMLRDLMAQMPDTTRIHFEMASFAEEACMMDVINNVVYYSDSLGMNEQELPNLHSLLNNGSVTLISDPYPRVATVLDQMRAIYSTLRNTPETAGRRKLTRLHVHTLAYQAILTTKGSPWKNTMSAAAKASLTANRHVCGSSYIHTEKARILMDDSFSTSRGQQGQRIPFQANRPVSCWEEEDFNICIAPVLVCTDVVQTGGGGDNVSSAGLVLQI